MAKAKKTPVFFIATKIKEQPIIVNFYTTTGKRVKSESVRKQKTDRGISYFATA